MLFYDFSAIFRGWKWIENTVSAPKGPSWPQLMAMVTDCVRNDSQFQIFIHLPRQEDTARYTLSFYEQLEQQKCLPQDCLPVGNPEVGNIRGYPGYCIIVIIIPTIILFSKPNSTHQNVWKQVTTAVDSNCGLGGWVVAAACLFGG